jgi:hypothetical protein
MDSEKDMVCHLKQTDNDFSNLFWGKFKLESKNTKCDDCIIDTMSKYDGIVLPMGLYYLQHLKTPEINYETKEEPLQDDLLKILMDMNNNVGGRLKKTSTNTNAIITKKYKTRRNCKQKKYKTRRNK